MRPKLSVLIPCYNSEGTIRATLESVKWADEILVCDSNSTDHTLDIAREYGARIIQHEYVNSANQKNWAIPQCRYEWVLIVDTDETLEAGLREEILEKLDKEAPSLDGYQIPRKNFVYGKWLQWGGIYPDFQLRLFRRDRGRYETREVHADFIVPGKVGTLEHHFLHQGFKDLSTWMIKSERYMKYEIDELTKQNRRFHVSQVTLYPFLVFCRTYFLKLGFLEGYRGFLLAILDGFYHFMVYAKLFERKGFKR